MGPKIRKLTPPSAGEDPVAWRVKKQVVTGNRAGIVSIHSLLLHTLHHCWGSTCVPGNGPFLNCEIRQICTPFLDTIGPCVEDGTCQTLYKKAVRAQNMSSKSWDWDIISEKSFQPAVKPERRWSTRYHLILNVNVENTVPSDFLEWLVLHKMKSTLLTGTSLDDLFQCN